MVIDPQTIATGLIGAGTTIAGAWLAYRTAVTKTKSESAAAFETRLDKSIADHMARLEGDIARQQGEITRQDAEIRRLSETNHECERRLIEAERRFRDEIHELRIRLQQFENLRSRPPQPHPQPWDGRTERRRSRKEAH